MQGTRVFKIFELVVYNDSPSINLLIHSLNAIDKSEAFMQIQCNTISHLYPFDLISITKDEYKEYQWMCNANLKWYSIRCIAFQYHHKYSSTDVFINKMITFNGNPTPPWLLYGVKKKGFA